MFSKIDLDTVFIILYLIFFIVLIINLIRYAKNKIKVKTAYKVNIVLIIVTWIIIFLADSGFFNSIYSNSFMSGITYFGTVVYGIMAIIVYLVLLCIIPIINWYKKKKKRKKM